MRPRLRTDAYFTTTPDGVYVLGHRGETVFTGSSIHVWLDRLRPYLDGRHTLADLTRELSADRVAMVEQVVQALQDNDLLTDAEADDGDEATDVDLRFVGYFGAGAASRLARYRDCATLVLGSGPAEPPLLAAVVRAAHLSGLRQVRVAVPASDAELTDTLDGASLVLHVADRAPLARAQLVDQLCAARGVTCVQAVTYGTHVWLSLAKGEGGWRRLAALSSGASTVDDVYATVIASQLVHLAFRHLTGAAPPVAERMIRVDPVILSSRDHTFLPHPFTRPATSLSEARFLATVTDLAEGARLEAAEFSRHAAAAVDSQLGVLRGLGEHRYAQTPLHVAEVTVSDPVGLLGPGDSGRVRVTGCGLDVATARHRTVLAGLAVYCSLMIDPRRLLYTGEAPTDPDRALAALRTGRGVGWIWGYRLRDRQVYRVPAARVFPALRTVPTGAYRVPVGVACGYRWADAVTAGLVAHGHRLALADVLAAPAPYPRIDLADVALDDAGTRYRALVAALGDPVMMYDVTGSLGLPMVAVCRAGRTVAYASATSGSEAVRSGLEQVLLGYQSDTNGEPEYSPGSIPDLPEPLRGRHVVAPRPAVGLDAVVAAVEGSGGPLVVVPLDHDPEVSRIAPYTVHVILVDG